MNRLLWLLLLPLLPMVIFVILTVLTLAVADSPITHRRASGGKPAAAQLPYVTTIGGGASERTSCGVIRPVFASIL